MGRARKQRFAVAGVTLLALVAFVGVPGWVGLTLREPHHDAPHIGEVVVGGGGAAHGRRIVRGMTITREATPPPRTEPPVTAPSLTTQPIEQASTWLRALGNVQAQHTAPGAKCALDSLSGSRPVAPAAGAERLLVYSPQFGLSNQLVAFRNAIAWALVLNRTLVVPHILHHATAEPLLPLGDAFDIDGGAAALLPHLRLRHMSDFLRGQHTPPARLVTLKANTKFAVSSDGYFAALGLRWHDTPGSPPLPVDMRSFMPAEIVSAFGGCHNHEARLPLRPPFPPRVCRALTCLI